MVLQIISYIKRQPHRPCDAPSIFNRSIFRCAVHTIDSVLLLFVVATVTVVFFSLLYIVCFMCMWNSSVWFSISFYQSFTRYDMNVDVDTHGSPYLYAHCPFIWQNHLRLLFYVWVCFVVVAHFGFFLCWSWKFHTQNPHNSLSI